MNNITEENFFDNQLLQMATHIRKGTDKLLIGLIEDSDSHGLKMLAMVLKSFAESLIETRKPSYEDFDSINLN